MTTKQIKTNTAAARILAFVAANPDTTARAIREALNLKDGTVAPTIKALKADGKLTTPTVLVDADTLTAKQAEKLGALPGEKVRVPVTFVQFDGEKAQRGRPAVALRVTDKGRKSAQRIVVKAAKLAEERAQAERHLTLANGEVVRHNTPSGLPVAV